ncbi:arsenate reductase [Amphibacillus marinus]|uniref:Arsenate reductase n=1 Tax=Amphibacillus marinus TaxID=872970 RepID=A0A1H8RXP5_9BACI|nr:arsenate reductase family protein [Amphibacillus marinus]SEO70974.1 arsenate reductase [Amphibacillus marinus]
MALKFYSYPKCGTCRNAKKWLEENDVQFDEIHLIEQPPSTTELKEMIDKSGLPYKRFFNTSGLKYRELGLKDKLADASDDQKLEWLASDGMLIKRPLAFDGVQVTVGFKEEQYKQTWK